MCGHNFRNFNSRFGRAHLACAICGEIDPRVFEFHQIGGVCVPLCRNCHRRLLVFTRIRPKAIWDPPDELERIGHALIAEADLFVLLAQARRKFGRLLIERVRREAPGEFKDET